MARRHKISFFVHDLAANPIVRTASLAKALEKDCDVEVLGFLLSGEDVYEPYRHLFPYLTMRVARNTGAVLRAIPALAAQATGDVIYACKPLVTSLGPALYAARRRQRRPLLLDVEDDEWVTPRGMWPAFLWGDVIKGWRHATAWKYTRALHALGGCADAVTVSTRRLQKRYGGTIVRNGPSGDRFDPNRPELFAGVPQPHKGWPILLEALSRQESAAWHLVLAGPPDHPDFSEAGRVLRGRCQIVGLQPNDRMPALLAAVGAVPAPQLDTPFAQSQLPAKVPEAMAMAREMITSCVGDLPEILGDGTRGWLIPPGDASALAAAFSDVAQRPDEVRARGAAARAWFLEEASEAVIGSRLLTMINAITRPSVSVAASQGTC